MEFRSEIPPLFHSEYQGEPFNECAVCGCSLLEPDVSYTVSKTCNQGEAIVELAVCDKCSDDLRNELSEESRKAVAEFVESRLMDAALAIDVNGEGEHDGEQDGDDQSEVLLRLLTAPADPPENPLDLIDLCSLCRKPRSDCRTFSITAYCVGGEMIVHTAGPLSLGVPAMLCDDCNAEATTRLSKETRETWDRFYNEVIDTPPRITLDGPMPMIGV